MTKNELKKEIYISAGKIMTFEEITTKAEKIELRAYKEALTGYFFWRVGQYETRYNPTGTDEVEQIKKHINNII